jgi:hypothetical protein
MMSLDEREAIKAYIDKEESEEFYIDAFEDYTKNGIEEFKWHWSWWAFGGGVFFLLYRKLYVEALVFFLISMISSSVPIASMIIWVASGGVFPYFVYKRYKKGKKMVEENISEPTKQLQALREFGGYNKWAIYAGVAMSLISLLGFLYIFTLTTAM